MEWAAVLRDIVVGLLVAGAVAAWVPERFWRAFFFVHHPTLSKFWGPLVGPVVSVLSFVCSVGNVPLAAVLWNGGISFGGVVSFVFADLIIVPVLAIYRKYYGTRMTLFLLGTFYVAMVLAGYVVEFLFQGIGLVPTGRHARVGEVGIHWDYTTGLDIAFLLLAGALLVRFVRTGGLPMLKMMGGGPAEHPGQAHEHSASSAHGHHQDR
jgi:uncharacterized membrane protein YraQ (UPF0718 family)